MSYQQFQPHPGLAPYIDAYWTVKVTAGQPLANRIMPDGCVDIIVNVGEDFLTDSGRLVMKSEKAYLVGTMTTYKDVIQQIGTHLIGVRFKPAAFSFFFNQDDLHAIVNQTTEFDEPVPDMRVHRNNIEEVFNRFFFDRLQQPRQMLLPVIDDINRNQGQLTVEALAKRHFVSQRKLERLFKQQIGTTPKEFVNFIRYQYALDHIQKFYTQKSLLEIAFESGYYDHAHLTNEIKKYAGKVPSSL